MSEFFKDPVSGEELAITLEGDDVPEPFRGKDMKAALVEAAQQLAETAQYKEAAAAHKAELEALKKGTTAELPKKERSMEEVAAEVKEKIEEDPYGVITRLMDERLAPLVMDQVKLNVDTMFSLARKDEQNFPEFGKYEEDVRRIVEQMPIPQRSNPIVFKTAFDLARVRDVDKMRAAFQERETTMVGTGVGAGLAPTAPAPVVASPEAALTEEEKRWAERSGMTPEEYRRWGKSDGAYGVPLEEERERQRKQMERAAAFSRERR